MNNEEKIIELLTSMKADIATLKTGQENMQEDIAALKTGQENMQEDITFIHTTISEIWKDISILEDKTNDNKDKIGELRSMIN